MAIAMAESHSIPLPPGQALLRRALLPIVPGEWSDDAARRADHARAEGGHRHVFTEAVDVHHRFVAAEIAHNPQQANALRPQVCERHRRAVVAIRGHAVNLPLDSTREQAR